MSESPLKLQLDAQNWDIVPLKGVSVFIKDGTHGTHERVRAGIPLLSAKNISPFGKITIDQDDSLISEDEYQKIHSKYELSVGDLLLTVVGTLGRSALVKRDKRFSIQRSIGVIRCSKSSVVPEFLYQFTGTDYFQSQLVLRSNATAQAGIYLGELAKIEVPRPPLPEQQKIAAILSSVDDVIEKTRAQIDKLKDLKTGMMQELLTRGIGSGGFPHTEFKDSPVGRIPAGWHDSTLKELCTVITKGTTPTTYGNSYTESGINFIKVECISRDGVLDDTKFSFIDEETHQKLSRSILDEGDILITIAGATVGKLAIVKREHLPANTNQALAVVRTDESKVLRDFVYYWLQSAFIKNSISNIQTVGAQPNLSLSQIGNFPVALPEFKEQQKIVYSLSRVDDLTALKRKKLVAAELTKKALMQDLLTGRVRAKIDQKESAVA